MSKDVSKSYVFYKNLFRPGVITPPKDKKLTFVHKLIVASILKPRKFKDIPSTISYFEWDHVKSRFMNRLAIASYVIVPIVFYFVVCVPIMEYQDRWVRKAELKKYGEIRENEKFVRW